MGLPSVMPSGHSFSQVPSAQIQRSSFNRSHGHKTSFDAGYLIPVYVDEVLPGDSFNLKMNAFVRLATPLKPIMDNLYLDSFFFFVPNRQIWDNWFKFNGEQVNPGDSTSFFVPRMQAPAGGWTTGSLSDYFGLPVGIASIYANSLWHRSYARIWNQWFRDENLQTSTTEDHGDGPDTSANYVLLRRGKRHDYFTSCLPWPQKSADVTLPLGTSATVKTASTELYTGAQNMLLMRTTAGALPAVDKAYSTGNPASGIDVSSLAASGSGVHLYPTNLYADLTNATASTINALRQAFQLQKLYERDARGGTRYYEILLAHFGVVDPGHLVLQRPLFLGGGSSVINVHPVPQMSATVAGQTAQGNLAAFGTGSVQGHGFTHSFTEHGVIIGLVSVRADLTYQQGMNRMFSRRSRFDFYWPALAHIGEQGVLNQEIYCDGTANDALIFGYQERFAEYRYKPSQISGLFRSNPTGGATTLDYWHLSQKFTALPTLGDTFIKDTPPVARVIAVTTEPHFLGDFFFDLKCARPMPTYSVPGMIDHF